MIGLLRPLWTYRGFIAESVSREFHSRYRGTQFGWIWAIIQPLAMLLVYTLVFSRVMRAGLPGHTSPWAYSIYLCAGLLAWGLFSELLSRSVGIFVSNANLLKKVSLPKLTLPAVVVVSGLINYGIVMGIFVAFLFLVEQFPGWVVLAAIPVVLLLVCLALGLGILLGTINVFYRDVEQMLGVVMQFWFWLTPVVYVARALPGTVAEWMWINPMWGIVHALQGIFLDARPPEWHTLLWPAAVAVVSLALALLAFIRLGGEIVDEL
ncbi:ABC transporter permease [Thauera aromatica]|nr:ABC transporter permease [Thauera aromatica]MCK2127066.1 ABC transporter permease [Thauera aromatica]